jgi:hypothetical protein
MEPSWCWSAATHPFTGARHNRLALVNLNGASFELDADHATKDNGDLFEIGSLPGLDPALGRNHPRDARFRVTRVDSSGVLLDRLRLVSGRFDH